MSKKDVKQPRKLVVNKKVWGGGEVEGEMCGLDKWGFFWTYSLLLL